MKSTWQGTQISCQWPLPTPIHVREPFWKQILNLQVKSAHDCSSADVCGAISGARTTQPICSQVPDPQGLCEVINMRQLNSDIMQNSYIQIHPCCSSLLLGKSLKTDLAYFLHCKSEYFYRNLKKLTGSLSYML